MCASQRFVQHDSPELGKNILEVPVHVMIIVAVEEREKDLCMEQGVVVVRRRSTNIKVDGVTRSTRLVIKCEHGVPNRKAKYQISKDTREYVPYARQRFEAIRVSARASQVNSRPEKCMLRS